jgi:hypothetical protein
VLTLLRTIFFVVAGWYLVKWFARWISGGEKEMAGDRGRKREERYESLTDQKIDDADYEDL